MISHWAGDALTTFGESHGEGVGGVIDGMPSGVAVDEAFIQRELDRRRPGQSPLTTGRKETDKVRLLSGIFEGKTTGTPIGFLVPNTDARPEDYATYRTLYRPSHADYTYQKKYGLRDYRGGGRSSARITLSRRFRQIGIAAPRHFRHGFHLAGGRRPTSLGPCSRCF